MRENPGPGTYEGNFKVSKRNDPRPIFGSATRNKQAFYETLSRMNPGPGTYQLKSIVGTGKTITISPRRPDTSP